MFNFILEYYVNYAMVKWGHLRGQSAPQKPTIAHHRADNGATRPAVGRRPERKEIALT